MASQSHQSALGLKDTGPCAHGEESGGNSSRQSQHLTPANERDTHMKG